MLSIRAVYDGNTIRFLEKIKGVEPQEVIITFLKSMKEKTFDLKKGAENDMKSEDIYSLIQNGGAFDFLSKEEEDIYSDKDLKIKY